MSAPFTLAVVPWSLPVIASNTTPHNGSKEYPMITETQTRIIVLQLNDKLLEQLQPFLIGLDIAFTAQHLTMRAEVYEMLARRVGSAPDYDVRWQPNEYETDGFVERVRPLQVTNGILAATGCPHCRSQLLANRAEVMCTCGQMVWLS